MNHTPETWQVNVNGQIYETNFEGLVCWINEGALHPQDKVRRGNLRWLEAGKIPALFGFFNAKELGIVNPPVVTTTSGEQPQPEPAAVAENQMQYASDASTGYAPPPDSFSPAAFNQPPPPPQFSENPPFQQQNYQQPNYQQPNYLPAAANQQQAETTEVAPEVKSGANWYFWIAGLSLVNSIILSMGGNWAFIAGLAITQFIDGVFDIIARESGTPAVNVIAFLINLVIAAVFVAFGVFARRGAKWAFIVGMILYTIDGLLYLLAGSILGVLIHGFALFCLFKGLQSCRD